MARIDGVTPDRVEDDYVRNVLGGQAKTWGNPLLNHLLCADAITLSDRDVDDDLFGRVRTAYDDDQVVELTMTIAWENASSKFNRALRIPSQRLWSHGALR